MIDNILYTSANIAGLGTSSSRSGSSSTSRSTSSATDGKTLYTLPDGKQYSMTKGEYEEFHAVFDKAASIAGASKMPLPKTTDVLKYGYAVLDSYERGMVFIESDFLAMMGAKQQQHEQQTNASSSAVPQPQDTTLYTLPDGKQYSLTKDQFDEFNNVYNKAYGIAYSQNIAAPRVSDVVKYGNVVLDWYIQGIPFDAAEYERRVMAGESEVPQPQAATQPTDPVSTGNKILDKLIEDGIAQQVSEDDWGTLVVDGHTFFENEERIKRKLAEKAAEKAAQQQAFDKLVAQNNASVAPSEEKGNSLLVPGIILALGVIGAIALTSKSKKKRR